MSIQTFDSKQKQYQKIIYNWTSTVKLMCVAKGRQANMMRWIYATYEWSIVFNLD